MSRQTAMGRMAQRAAAAVFLFWGVLLPLIAAFKVQDLGVRRMAVLAAVDLLFAAGFLSGGALLLAGRAAGASLLLAVASGFLVVYLGVPINFLSGYSALALATVPAAMILVLASCRGHLLGAPDP